MIDLPGDDREAGAAPHHRPSRGGEDGGGNGRATPSSPDFHATTNRYRPASIISSSSSSSERRPSLIHGSLGQSRVSWSIRRSPRPNGSISASSPWKGCFWRSALPLRGRGRGQQVLIFSCVCADFENRKEARMGPQTSGAPPILNSMLASSPFSAEAWNSVPEEEPIPAHGTLCRLPGLQKLRSRYLG